MNFIKYPNTNRTEYQYVYDSLGNLEQVNEVDGVNLIDILADFEGYNALGQIGYAGYANGTGVDYVYYDDNYRLHNLITTNASGVIQQLDYTFDNVGNVDTLISNTKPLATGPTYTVNYDFDYDNLDRLTSATAASSDSARAYNQTYQYDEVGNMTRKTGIGGWEVLSWDSSYQPKKPASVRFDFESEGIGRRNITYNHANKPVQISYKGGTPTYLTYDGEGNRIKKVQGSSTTIYVGDIFEKRGALEVSHIYAHGKRIISRTSDGKEYYTHTDHLGSTNLVTDETGQVIEENGYLPFGGALFRNEYNGGTFKSAYRYTGQEHDSEYELYNYNARLYDPVMSRFISPDTIIPDQYNPQALNRYSYCLNNPLKYTDPSGHIIWADPNVEHEMRGRGKGFNFSQLIALDPYYTFVLKPMIGEHSYMHYIGQQKDLAAIVAQSASNFALGECPREPTKNITIEEWQTQVEKKLDELRSHEDFRKLEKKYGPFTIKAEYTADCLSHYNQFKTSALIIINPHNVGMSYRYQPRDAPPIGGDPTYGFYPLSLERLIVHEVYHGPYPFAQGENEVILWSNIFMDKYYKHYNEPWQLPVP